MKPIAPHWDGVKTGLRTALIRIGYHSRPGFLIVGAQKCGTTALRSYLSKHPRIIPASKKEIHFFDLDVAYNRGMAWYHGHFPLPHRLTQGAITFEATPSYLFSPGAPERIFSYDSQMRLIVLLRNPVDRAYSAWNMYHILIQKNPEILLEATRDSSGAHRRWVDDLLSGTPFHEFDEAVQSEIEAVLAGSSAVGFGYVRRGLYYDQLLRYLRYFDREQILTIDSRLLKSNTALALNQVVRFLGMPEHNWHQERLLLVHNRPYEEGMSQRARAMLSEFYKPYNERLYELLGRDFDWN